MLIDNKKDLIRNLDKVEHYLNSNIEDDFDTMANYIRRGRVLVAYKVGDNIHFAPSRFVGYKANTLVKHENNSEKDGTITTPIITGILGKNKFSKELDAAYIKYCSWLGKEASRNKRTYWLLNEDIIGEMTTEPFTEGTAHMRVHLVRERNRKVVEEAKSNFKKTHNGKLYCEICNFDFLLTYGKIGDGFIEAHHKISFASKDNIHEIKPSDFLMVCPNCHSMLHRPGASIQKLKKLFK